MTGTMRTELVDLARSLFERGFSVGSAGNISVRLPDGGYLMTPTNSSLGRLDPDRLSELDADFVHVGGDKPSKEVVMHQAVYRARPDAGAIVHLHSTYLTALSCLAPPATGSLLPPLTPYFVMKTGGQVPVVDYFKPGTGDMVDAIFAAAGASPAVILANHGSLVAGPTLVEAVNSAEELEATAQLAFLLRDAKPDVRPLTPNQVAALLN